MTLTVHPGRQARGFTLLELLIVVAIAGLTIGLVALRAGNTPADALQEEAHRLALLFQSAREEAIVRNRQVTFEADGHGYRFLVEEDRHWQAITGDALLRERPFSIQPLTLSLQPPPAAADASVRILFGREPVDAPFVLTLQYEEVRFLIQADGAGHFEVQP